jgi:SprT protein
MRTTPQQLAFNFGQILLRRLNRLPGAPAVRRNGASKLRHDPILEEVARVLLRQLGCRRLAKEISVCWNPRMRTTAGIACYRRKAVHLNPKLVEVSAAEVQRTLRHELAHLIARARAGRRRIAPHGPEWREACVDLGIRGESRCHDLPFKARRITRRHFYQCRECGTIMGRVRPVKRRMACLRCCRKHNGGRYHEQFRFMPVAEPERIAA